MGGQQTKVNPVEFYHDVSEERKQVLRDIIVIRVKEIEHEDKIDLRDLNEYIFLNHKIHYCRLTRRELAEIISSAVSRPHILLPNHIWFIREKS